MRGEDRMGGKRRRRPGQEEREGEGGNGRGLIR
jgi:hypothetical protein